MAEKKQRKPREVKVYELNEGENDYSVSITESGANITKNGATIAKLNTNEFLVFRQTVKGVLAELKGLSQLEKVRAKLAELESKYGNKA